jgi:protein-tyrosine phosphatase
MQMIDIHTHIIPNVDDGAINIEESLRMIKKAEEDGIKTIVATPHVFNQLSRFKSLRELEEKFTTLRNKIKQNQINVRLLKGAENYFVPNLKKKLQDYRHILTINNSDYFLLEFPAELIFPGTKEFLFDLIADGFTPIICHPERNSVIQSDLKFLYQFLQLGALSQINAGSLMGTFGPEASITAHNLIKYNMVHIIASDCHNSTSRPPKLSPVYEHLSYIEKDKIDIMVLHMPQAVINNEAPIDTGTLIEPVKKTFFSSIMEKILK